MTGIANAKIEKTPPKTVRFCRAAIILARPSRLVPQTAEAMPEVSKDGRTYVLHVKSGILLTPDPAFKGIRRELTAQDYESNKGKHEKPVSTDYADFHRFFLR